MVLPQGDIHMQKNKVRLPLAPYTNLKQTNDQDIRAKTIKFLEQTIEQNFMTLGILKIQHQKHKRRKKK